MTEEENPRLREIATYFQKKKNRLFNNKNNTKSIIKGITVSQEDTIKKHKFMLLNQQKNEISSIKFDVNKDNKSNNYLNKNKKETINIHKENNYYAQSLGLSITPNNTISPFLRHHFSWDLNEMFSNKSNNIYQNSTSSLEPTTQSFSFNHKKKAINDSYKTLKDKESNVLIKNNFLYLTNEKKIGKLIQKSLSYNKNEQKTDNIIDDKENEKNYESDKDKRNIALKNSDFRNILIKKKNKNNTNEKIKTVKNYGNYSYGTDHLVKNIDNEEINKGYLSLNDERKEYKNIKENEVNRKKREEEQRKILLESERDEQRRREEIHKIKEQILKLEKFRKGEERKRKMKFQVEEEEQKKQEKFLLIEKERNRKEKLKLEVEDRKRQKEQQNTIEHEDEKNKQFSYEINKTNNIQINNNSFLFQKSNASLSIYPKKSKERPLSLTSFKPYLKKTYRKSSVVFISRNNLREKTNEKFSKCYKAINQHYSSNQMTHRQVATKSNQSNYYCSSYFLPRNNELNGNLHIKNAKMSSFTKKKIPVQTFSSYGLLPYNYIETKKYKNEFFQINIEDLIKLEEKFSEMITSLNAKRPINNECFEIWDFCFNCSLFKKIENAFTNEEFRKVIEMCINNILLSLIICYDVSFDSNSLMKIYVMIKAIVILNHENLILICEYILSKISKESLNNMWVIKLRNLVNTLNSVSNYTSNNIISNKGIERIKENTNSISSNLTMIIKNYSNDKKASELFHLYKNQYTISYDDINKFFRGKIMRIENSNANVILQGTNIQTDPVPYLNTTNLKPYTLVLELDETIIHFKVKNENEGVIKVRPGIFEFLETLGKYYEIVVFTVATQDYADVLINNVEENKIYFDYRLYRQHTVIIGDDFVKDLTKLGRPLDKIIIVDNMPQNFRLQKENGIKIRAYWGEDDNDTVLLDLMEILVNIANEGGDVRKGLEKYKDEIFKKVTTNTHFQSLI